MPEPRASPTLLTRMSRPPKRSTVAIDDARHAVRRRDVGRHGEHTRRMPDHRAELRGRLVQLHVTARTHRHAAAVVEERSRAGQPEPAARPGHDSHLAFELEVHAVVHWRRAPARTDQGLQGGKPGWPAGKRDVLRPRLPLSYRPPRPVRSFSVQSKAENSTLNAFPARNSRSVVSRLGSTKARAARSIGLRLAKGGAARSA